MSASRALLYSSIAPLTAALLVAGIAAATAQEPLRIARQGSIEAGGEIVHCATTDGGSLKPIRQIAGKVRVGHVYATYQYPANQTFKYPVLFNPGGGHAARVYDTTPDGREGWLTTFVREGFAVYGVDRVNSGRSGQDICTVNAARLGVIPAAQMPTMNRYSAEAAWVEFRWGPKYGTWYEDTQFPKEALDTYLSQLIPNFRDPQELQKAVSALSALLEKTGPAILQSWSSGGLIIYKTAIARPDLVKGVLALENSAAAFDEISDDEVKRITKVPMINVIADRTPDRVEGARKFQKRMQAAGGHFTVDSLPEAGIRGNGHTMMLEKNNQVIMDRMVKWLRATVKD